MHELGAQERARLVERFGRSFRAGDTIYSVGDDALACFMVHEGRVRLIKKIGPVERTLGVVRQGELFGQESLLENAKRRMSALALTDGVVLAFDQSTLKTLVLSTPEVGLRLLELTVERLRYVEEQLESHYVTDKNTRVLQSILRLLEGASPTEDGHVLPISPLELAVRTGLDVDSVKTVVQQLRASGYVNLADERIMIPRLEPLRRLSELVSMGESEPM